MTLRELQPEPLDLLDRLQTRAAEVVDPTLLELVRSRIACIVADAAETREPADDRERDVVAVIDQMLIDVASVDDDTVRRADRHFPPGGLANLVLAAYAWEAGIRLRVMSERLLGGMG